MRRISLLFLGTLMLSLPAVAQQSQAQRDQQQANRERCVNGGVIGGVVGAVLPRSGWRNRVAGGAIGATAGCVINRGVNEGK